MMLRNVKIENFRGIRNLDLDLEVRTVLIGENNCGKTSILEGIRLALSRGIGRRSNPFEDHDYHLTGGQANPGSAGPLRIVLSFRESQQGEWPPEIIQALPDAAVLDAGTLYQINFAVTSTFDASIGDFITDWEFLNPNGQAIPKAKRGTVIGTLQNLFVVHYLTAFRDSARDFSPKSAFWGPFLRNPSIPDATKVQLEAELAALNTKILNADQRLQAVSANLGKAQKVVTLGQTDTVTIDALPSHIWDMLSRAQVNVAAVTGASLPLLKHGAGTQSLASIFLFEAFFNSGIGKPDPDTSYLLQIEEPEAHLHPSAIRTLWPTLQATGQQTIIATHSGDLLSEVSLNTIRRLTRVNGNVEVRRVNTSSFAEDDLRKIHFHIRRHRGELLFARTWLLHEGETEYWILYEMARLSNIPLEQKGVRLVEYANVGLDPILQLADQLGIQWHCVSDADPAGIKYANRARAKLNGRTEADHLSIMPAANIEEYLCSQGFGHIYSANISPQKANLVTVQPGHAEYWKQVLKAQSEPYKVQSALKVIQAIEAGATPPAYLLQILNSAVALGGV